MVKRKCVRGWPCGGSCISRKKKCNSNLDQNGEKLVENFVQYITRIRPEGGAAGAIARGDKEDNLTQGQRLLEATKNRPKGGAAGAIAKGDKEDNSQTPKKKKTWKEVKSEKSGNELYRKEPEKEWKEEGRFGSVVAVYGIGDNTITAGAQASTEFSQEDILRSVKNTNLEDILRENNIDKSEIRNLNPELVFTVNDNFAATDLKPLEGKNERATAIAVAQGARLALMEVVDKLPDNTILLGSPTMGDGKGESRIKLYKRMGFDITSEPEEEDDIKMRAIKINGKIIPLTYKDNES